MSNVVIKSAAVDEETNMKSGEIMRSQMAGLDLGNGYELPFKVGLGKRPAYKPGAYAIDPKCYGQNEYGGLILKKYVDLVPVGAAPAKA